MNSEEIKNAEMPETGTDYPFSTERGALVFCGKMLQEIAYQIAVMNEKNSVAIDKVAAEYLKTPVVEPSKPEVTPITFPAISGCVRCGKEIPIGEIYCAPCDPHE